MRLLFFTLMLVFMTTQVEAQTPSAIEIVKQHPKIKQMLDKHPSEQYQISFGEVEMGGNCGFVGCTWQKLVSLVITAKRVNAPSMTILAEVTGNIPVRNSEPSVRFVDLKDIDPTIWQSQL